MYSIQHYVIKFESDLWQVGYSGDEYSLQHYVIKFVSDVYTIQHYVIKFMMCTRYNII